MTRFLTLALLALNVNAEPLPDADIAGLRIRQHSDVRSTEWQHYNRSRVNAAEVAELMQWLAVWAPELAAPPAPPGGVEYLPNIELQRYTGRGAASSGFMVLGTCYLGIVYLDMRLDVVNDYYARSILLHEMVHYYQDGCRVPETADVRNTNEAQAYAIQDRWVKQHAKDDKGRARPSRWVE